MAGQAGLRRYHRLLTDVLPAEIHAIGERIAAGELHPMQAKRDLARVITAGFHTPEVAAHAEENWSRQFQQGGVSDDIEEIGIAQATLAGPEAHNTQDGVPGFTVRVPALLVHCGLASSNAEATRKLREGAVKIDGAVYKDLILTLPGMPATLTLRLGKRAKRALLT